MTDAGHLRLGSRGSALALWQTRHVADALCRLHPGLTTEIVVIKTTGDKILDVPLARIGDRGLFVKEIEEALLAGTIDLAVHSLKDLPTQLPAGLSVAAVLPREDARDCVVSVRFAQLASMPAGTVVGTSSLRRRAQLQRAFPQLAFADVRGNLQTRLAKLERGEYDALVLAAAGLTRLDLAARITEYLPPDICLPAVGQGVLAVECRAADARVQQLLAPLEDGEARACVLAERSLLAALEGGCQVPIAAHATCHDGELHLTGLVAALTGSPCLRFSESGTTDAAVSLGQRVAQQLRAQGADELLEHVRRGALS
ncbi:MAG: hydroxymethylbilane synthase [Candidatus Sericytochromatia bacterium]|nr:hydroxymethylbilane synthase [Candidatus Sericytochromatia bacterium]